jgi:hypothetical protein
LKNFPALLAILELGRYDLPMNSVSNLAAQLLSVVLVKVVVTAASSRVS